MRTLAPTPPLITFLGIRVMVRDTGRGEGKVSRTRDTIIFSGADARSHGIFRRISYTFYKVPNLT